MLGELGSTRFLVECSSKEEYWKIISAIYFIVSKC